MDTNALIDDYLHALLLEASRLPGSQAADLIADVREHVAEAVAAAGSDDEATIRTILDRLGSPEAIVAATQPAGEPVAAAPIAPVAGDKSMGNTEIAAVLLMSVGSFMVPVVAPLAGIYLARTSTKWSPETKRRATWLGALSAAWMPLLFLLLAVAFTQGPILRSAFNLLPGVQYEQNGGAVQMTPNAACNQLQIGNQASATASTPEGALGALASMTNTLALSPDQIPGEWIGAHLDGLVAGVASTDDWRVLQRTSDSMFVGVAHVTPGEGGYVATVVGDCGTLSFQTQ